MNPLFLLYLFNFLVLARIGMTTLLGSDEAISSRVFQD